MKEEKDPPKVEKPEPPREQPQRSSSAFNEQSTKDLKSTRNIEEEAVKNDKEQTVGNGQ